MKSSNYKILLISLLLPLNALSNESIPSNQIQSWLRMNDYLILSEPLKLDTLDPIQTVNAHTKFTLPLIFESLIAINSQQELQPVLAKTWQIAQNGKSVVLTLKSNHRFSDNTEVTAKDVVNSIHRLCSPTSQEYGELRGLIGCKEYAKGSKETPQVYQLNKYEIKFNINSSPTSFLYELSSPSSVITKNTKAGLIGSAQYLLTENTSDHIVLNLNPYYVGDLKAQNRGIIMFYTSGPNATNMIATNKPDGALMYRMKDFASFKNSNYKLIKSNSNITETLVFNTKRFPFNIPIVRKALTAEIYNNFNHICISGTRKSYGIIPSGIGGSINNMQPILLPEITPQKIFTEVPELKSKRKTVIIHQLYNVKNDCESDQIIQAAKKYHIDIKFKYHADYSDLLPLYKNHNLDGFLELYVIKNREAYKIFDFFSFHGENDANISDDNIDKMLNSAIAMPSSHSRFQVYRNLAQHIQDNGIAIPIYYMDHENIMKKCLSGIEDDFFFNPFSQLPHISKSNCTN